MRGRQTDQRRVGGLGRENVGQREALCSANSKIAAKRLYSLGAINPRKADMGLRGGGVLGLQTVGAASINQIKEGE